MSGKTLVVGIGNPLRSDDGVGAAVADWVHERSLSDVTVVKCRGENIDLLSLWKGYSRVILVDAMTSEMFPLGTVKVFLAHKAPLPTDFERNSTHGMGPHESIELARVLGELPPYLAMVAIAGENFEMGQFLTGLVSQSISEAGTVIESLLGGDDLAFSEASQ